MVLFPGMLILTRMGIFLKYPEKPYFLFPFFLILVHRSSSWVLVLTQVHHCPVSEKATAQYIPAIISSKDGSESKAFFLFIPNNICFW